MQESTHQPASPNASTHATSRQDTQVHTQVHTQAERTHPSEKLFARSADDGLDHQDEKHLAQSDHPTTSIHQSEQVCAHIREHLIDTQGRNRVRRYLSRAVSMGITAQGEVELVAGDRFTLDMIERRLGDPLRIAAQFALGTTNPTILYRVEPTGQIPPKGSPGRDAHKHGNDDQAENSGSAEPIHPLATRVDSRAGHSRARGATRFPACPSLNDFVVGTSNRLAYESIRQVILLGVESPPIFVHGSCGVGKTHLLRGAGALARQVRPGSKARYTTGEAFTNGFVTAIRTRSMEAFQKKYRGLDLLCIDDIHLMAGKQATQHELLQIFNKLSLGGCTIILASDAHPREIARLDQALASRFAAGLVVKVDEPDPELARRLVAQIASKRGLFLDAPAIATIIDRVGIGRGASVRDLEGAVVQIQAVTRLMDQSGPGQMSTIQSGDGPSDIGEDRFKNRTMRSGGHMPTMSHIRKALSLRTGSASGSLAATGPIALDSIITRVCEEMLVSKSDLRGKGRQKKVVMARELIVHTARNLTSKSFPEIAYAIGRPNHSTVITAAKRFKDRIAQCQPIAVDCPHDGLPAGELAELMADRVHSALSIQR